MAQGGAPPFDKDILDPLRAGRDQLAHGGSGEMDQAATADAQMHRHQPVKRILSQGQGMGHRAWTLDDR